ncbi:MAG: KTSC domain-containing protein [Thermoplasmata archaeon]|nr:KTSC domain-containing protein [Thermoplasmata archaeon]
MERVHVSSSNLVSIGYDPESKTLEVEFRSGSIYQYYDIPGIIYSGLMSAASHGRYLDAYIVKSSFASKRIK